MPPMPKQQPVQDAVDRGIRARTETKTEQDYGCCALCAPDRPY